MRKAYTGQTRYMQSPMGFGGAGYGDSYVSSDGGYGYASSPFASSLGGYGGLMGGGRGTTFGGMRVSDYGQNQSIVPKSQPTVNDLFSQYFSKQYYGGDAFDPFASTSIFGGGSRGMGGRMRRRRQTFEDLFSPQQPSTRPDLIAQPAVQPGSELVAQPAVMPESVQVQPQSPANLPIDFGYARPISSGIFF